MAEKKFEGQLEIELAKVGRPTSGDRLATLIKGALNTAAAVGGPYGLFAAGAAALFDAVPKEAEENLISFVRDLARDADALSALFDVERMKDPHYMGIWVKVLKAAQLEFAKEKKMAYRAILLNPLISMPPHPWAQQEFFLSVLESLGVYAILTLKILHDPQQARRTFEARPNHVQSGASPSFWEVAFFWANGELEQPTFAAVLQDLDSKRLIELEPVSRSPVSVMGTDLLNASRMLTDFGKEFVAFITLPDSGH